MSKENNKAKRRILKGHIQFLSLCPKGANTISTVYKADDGKDKNLSFSSLSKDMNEKGEIIACVYSPNLVDSQGDVASAEVIKQMAYDFAKEGVGIDIRHDNKPISKDQAHVAESFIIQKNDPRYADMKDYNGNPVDVTQGWGVVIKVEDDNLKNLYRTGQWGGISMGGFVFAESAGEKEDSALTKALTQIGQYFNKLKTNKENLEIEDMDAKEFKEILAENNKALATVLKEALQPQETEAQKAERIAKEEASKNPKKGLGYPKPILKEQPTAEDIAQYEKKLEIFELSKAVDPENLESIRQFQIMSKKIALGEKVETRKDQDAYGSFFQTNQDSILTNKSDNTTDEYSKLILDSIEKEEKEKAKK